MNLQEAKAAIEALLFTMGRSVSVEELAGVLEIDKDTVVKIVHCMMDEYAVRNRGIRIIELDDAFQMCTKPETKAVIEKIRGVSCDHAINRLIEYDLVCEAGRLEAPGRPILFATTEEFLRVFGLKSREDLPVVDAVKMEEFKEEAEEEAGLNIDV